MYLFFEILGTIAFAISGAMVAIEKKMDILGVMILGITTAVGGGIIRDVLIRRTPPVSLENPTYALIALAVSLIVFIPDVRSHVHTDSRLLVLIDAIGLGTFTVVGCKAVAPFDNIWLQIFLGVMTGVGGGVCRDIFAAQMPIIFVKHCYAVASFAGAIVYSGLLYFSESIAMILSIFVVVVIECLPQNTNGTFQNHEVMINTK